MPKIQEALDRNATTKGKFYSLPESIVSLDTGSHAPSWVRQYKIPQSLIEVVDKTVVQWLEDNIITLAPPGCAWNSPLLVVGKKDELGRKTKYRTCLDPRHINAKLMEDRHPVPLLSDILDDLSGAKIFSTLDLESSFHQFLIKEEDRPKTAFTWRNIQYMFNGAPFGLKTLTSVFQRVTSRLFRLFKTVSTYVDDIIISTKQDNFF
eukprot:Pompholyxophrys_punicea_v1_NODE_19_length_5902_cov_21.503677.p3 type:complete len:207 gc:universal NODE_19_length_5902_cov_21.503677:3288-2668(-)